MKAAARKIAEALNAGLLLTRDDVVTLVGDKRAARKALAVAHKFVVIRTYRNDVGQFHYYAAGNADATFAVDVAKGRQHCHDDVWIDFARRMARARAVFGL